MLNPIIKQRLLYLIPLIILLTAFSIFPFGLFKIKQQNSALEKGMAVSGPIMEDTPIAGIFQPQHKTLSSIGFRFYVPGSRENTGYLRLLLKNQQDMVIYESTIPINELKNNQFFDFPLGISLDTAQPYVYQLNAYDYGDTAPCIYLGSPDTASVESRSLYYNGLELPGNAPTMRYTYRAGASFTQALPYYIVLVLLLLLTIPLWGHSCKKLCTGVCLLITVILLVLAADESRRPLVLTGDNLRRDAGSVDGTSIVINPDSGFHGKLAYTWNYMLEKGNYRVGIEYRTDTADNTLYIYNNGETALTHALNPAYTYQEILLPLEKDSQEILIELHYNGTASLTINSLQLTPENRFYNDAVFCAVLLFIGGILLFLLTRSRFFIQMPVHSKMIGFGLLSIAAAASLPLMNSYLNWADDLCYHLIRIEGIKDGLLDGQFPVVIFPEGLYGNGYLNCMYPNLFLYFPAILRILGVSMANSYKFLVTLFNLLTAFLTYYSIKSLMTDKMNRHHAVSFGTAISGRFSAGQLSALLAALLYTLCPYRFTNAYARGALGEFLAMTFMPLLLAGLYHVLLGDRKRWWMLVLGISGLIQTHILSAVIGLIFCFVCGMVCLAAVIREKRIGSIVIASLMTLLLNLWFAVPFVYFYTSGVLWPSALDWCKFSEYSLNLSGLAGTINTQDYRTLTLGLPIVICAVFSLFAIYFTKKRDRLCKYIICLFVLGCCSTFMVINQFPGWPLMEIHAIEFILKNIQFAWRMLGPASILFVMTGCILLFRFEAVKPYRIGIFLTLSALSLLSVSRFQADDFAYKNYYDTYTVGHESKLRGIPKGDNTIIYPYEWRPYGTVESDLSTKPVFTDETAVTVQNFKKTGTTNELTYVCTSLNQTVSLPIIHYAGYRAYDENGKRIELSTNADNNTIQIALIGDSQEHQIVVKYKGLLRFTGAFWISLITLSVWIWLFIRRRRPIVTDRQS